MSAMRLDFRGVEVGIDVEADVVTGTQKEAQTPYRLIGPSDSGEVNDLLATASNDCAERDSIRWQASPSGDAE